MERVALTGKNKIWGSVLYLLARESKAQTILELGSCAGISAAYLSASEHCEVLHTIEGSAALSRLAQDTLEKLDRKAIVHNALFDDALDDILPQIELIDLAFIDGHHEKVATIHYWERIAPKTRPGSIIIFDDIAWSQDMRDAWLYLSKQPAFCDAADFGPIGVCICGEQSGVDETRYWDLQSLLGKQQVGQPHGWSRKEGDVVL
nr:class I SAM-dependent methyltransferase [Desulfobulbus alkaliphilus]